VKLKLSALNICGGNSDEEGASLDELIADEAWLEEYHRKREEDNERMRDLEVRFKGNKPVKSWSVIFNT
jgi:hypothetical protein